MMILIVGGWSEIQKKRNKLPLLRALYFDIFILKYLPWG
jgi:hypothetical protein